MKEEQKLVSTNPITTINKEKNRRENHSDCIAALSTCIRKFYPDVPPFRSFKELKKNCSDDPRILQIIIDFIKKELSKKEESFFDVLEKRNYKKDFILGLIHKVIGLTIEITREKKIGFLNYFFISFPY